MYVRVIRKTESERVKTILINSDYVVVVVVVVVFIV